MCDTNLFYIFPYILQFDIDSMMKVFDLILCQLRKKDVLFNAVALKEDRLVRE